MNEYAHTVQRQVEVNKQARNMYTKPYMMCARWACVVIVIETYQIPSVCVCLLYKEKHARTCTKQQQKKVRN